MRGFTRYPKPPPTLCDSSAQERESSGCRERTLCGAQAAPSFIERTSIDPGVVVEVAIEETVDQLEVLLLTEQLDALRGEVRGQ
jgi:hypothetical protein